MKLTGARLAVVVTGLGLVAFYFFYTLQLEAENTLTVDPKPQYIYIEKCGLPQNYCPWEFVKYVQSDWEKLWVTHAAEWGESPCDRWYFDNNQNYSRTWFEYSQAAVTTRPTSANLPNADIFSYLEYTRTCTGEEKKIWIEPMAVIARNPLTCDPNNSFWHMVGSKNHILVDWEIADVRNDTNGKVFLFDLGASTYLTGLGGASQSWFIQETERRGLKFNGIFAWEYTLHDAKKVFNEIPQRLWPIYHWYNIPVEDQLGNMTNPWELMTHVATKDDIVIVKVDIDTPHLEISLIKQVIANKTISDLIDVLYYEDHTNTTELNVVFQGWKNPLPQKLPDTFDLFVSMREKGIRAHAWV